MKIIAFLLFLTTLAAEPYLKGIVLLPGQSDLNYRGYKQTEGIDVCRVDAPSPKSLAKKLSKYCECPLSEELICAIKEEIIYFYRDHDRPIVTVMSPQYATQSDVLQLIVIEGRVGCVDVCGNCYFSSERLRNYLCVQPGDVIRSDVVNRDLAWINVNPFRQVDLVYRPGREFGTTDLEMVVQDRKTYRFFGGVDNTGNDVIGNNRIFAGVNWGNVFGSDHILSYEFSASPEVHRFMAHTIYYKMPLPWRHIMTLYGGYSSVKSNYNVPAIVGTKFRNKGYNAQASLRYDFFLPPFYSFLHEFGFGFDYKRMNNALQFGGIPIITTQNINLTQFMVYYNLGYQTERLATSFEFEVYSSPFRWLPDQSNRDFQALRPFAKSVYAYGRGSFTFVHHFHPCVYYSIYLRGQCATANLLPSEEYGLGGWNTVRGYKERQENADNAINFNIELLGTPFPLSRLFGYKKGRDELQLLAFLDYGAGFVHKEFLNIDTDRALFSYGPGMRYRILSYIQVRLDYGIQVHKFFDPVTADDPHHRLHFQVIGSY